MTGRKFGYLVAALVNLFLLWIANHLLEWAWPAFLTAEWNDLLPLVRFSLWATVAVNVLWMLHDPAWFRHLAQAGLNAVTLVVIIETWQIFPFDFSGYANGWELATHITIIVGIVGSGIGVVAELAKLIGTAGHHPLGHGGRHATA